MKKLLVFVPIALLIIGCPRPEKDYYPLTEGNTWDYRMITTMTIGGSTISDTFSAKSEITAKTTLNNGTEVYEEITTVTIDPVTTKDTSYVQETADYILGYDDKADTKPDTILALPLEEGKTWRVSHDTTATALGKESVTVPADTYDDCWKIVNVADKDSIFFYLAPEVGLIKVYSKVIAADTTAEFTMELKSATIK